MCGYDVGIPQIPENGWIFTQYDMRDLVSKYKHQQDKTKYVDKLRQTVKTNTDSSDLKESRHNDGVTQIKTSSVIKQNDFSPVPNNGPLYDLIKKLNILLSLDLDSNCHPVIVNELV